MNEALDWLIEAALGLWLVVACGFLSWLVIGASAAAYIAMFG